MINKIKKLKIIAKYLRQQIIEISFEKKAHHIGSQFSCVEIITSLYFHVMNISPRNINDPNRDWFFLSKGHAALIQYLALSKKEFFSYKVLCKEFLSNGGKLGSHPDYKTLPGIEISSGSLGHCLSIAAGIALAKKRDKLKGNVYVLLSDGECNEGMVWEAAMFAAHHNLNNLIGIIDHNKFQALGKNKDIIKLNSLSTKFKSFGWISKEIDGHNISEIIKNFNFSNKKNKKPRMVIANTIKGKGAKSIEGKLSSHYEIIKDKKRKNKLLNEL